MVTGKSVAWVLTFTRLAADRLGKVVDAYGDSPDPAPGKQVVANAALVPTRMDRPEDIETNPVNARVCAALTNSALRTAATVDEANPLAVSFAHAVDALGAGSYAERPGNRDGHVIEWLETDGIAGRDYYWRILIVAGDPDRPETYSAGYDESKVSPMSCPDNVAFDPAGNPWISTHLGDRPVQPGQPVQHLARPQA